MPSDPRDAGKLGLLTSGELVAAMTRNKHAVELNAQGVPVKFARPKDGALT